jgi:hypothetical protein
MIAKWSKMSNEAVPLAKYSQEELIMVACELYSDLIL